MFYRLVSDTATGLVQKQTDELKPLGVQSAGRLKQEYQNNIDDLMSTMHDFIKENRNVFPDYGPFNTEICTDCNIKGRHYGFNTRR